MAPLYNKLGIEVISAMGPIVKMFRGLSTAYRNERHRCQSCGMPLVYDRHPRAGQIYCSYCHDGASFLNEGATLRAMQDKVDALLVARRAPSLLRLYMRLRLMTLKRWRGSARSRPKGAGAAKAQE